MIATVKWRGGGGIGRSDAMGAKSSTITSNYVGKLTGQSNSSLAKARRSNLSSFHRPVPRFGQSAEDFSEVLQKNPEIIFYGAFSTAEIHAAAAALHLPQFVFLDNHQVNAETEQPWTPSTPPTLSVISRMSPRYVSCLFFLRV